MTGGRNKDASSLIETAHLLRSPRNAPRLLGAIGRAIKGEAGTVMTVEEINYIFSKKYFIFRIEILKYFIYKTEIFLCVDC